MCHNSNLPHILTVKIWFMMLILCVILHPWKIPQNVKFVVHFLNMIHYVYFLQGALGFWYNLLQNGEGDYETRHAACPVLTGNKWGEFIVHFVFNLLCTCCWWHMQILCLYPYRVLLIRCSFKAVKVWLNFSHLFISTNKLIKWSWLFNYLLCHMNAIWITDNWLLTYLYKEHQIVLSHIQKLSEFIYWENWSFASMLQNEMTNKHIAAIANHHNANISCLLLFTCKLLVFLLEIIQITFLYTVIIIMFI